MKKLSLVAGLVCATISSIACAQSSTSVLFNAGTQGVGVELIQPLDPNHITVSLQGNYFKLDHSFSAGDGNYDGHVKFLNGGLLLNYHPFYGPFKLSGGGYYNANKIAAYIDDSSSGPDADAAGNAQIKYKKFAPYAGLGWDWGHTVLVGLDLGVLFEGRPSVDFSGCAACSNQAQEIQSKLDDYTRYYPVVRLGIGF